MKIAKFYDGCIVKDETKEYVLYKVIEAQGIREEYYKLVEKNKIEEMQEIIDRLKQQLKEQQEMNSATQEAVTEMYELILNEDPIQ